MIITKVAALDTTEKDTLISAGKLLKSIAQAKKVDLTLDTLNEETQSILIALRDVLTEILTEDCKTASQTND